MKFFYTLCFILLFCYQLVGQDLVFSYEKLSTEIERIEKGLSQNSINTLFQDEDGFLWIGTWSGLNRYDGSNFVILSSNPENPLQSLSSSVINAIAEDHKGNLWIGTENGLNRVSKKSLIVQNYISSSLRFPMLNDSIFSLLINQNQLWIGSQKGLFLFDNTSDSIKLIPTGFPTLLQQSQIRVLKKTTNQNILIGTDNGLWEMSFDAKNPNQPKFTQINRYSILAIQFLNDSLYLIGTERGLLELNFKNKTNRRIEILVQNKPISNPIITDILIDRNKNIWVTTSGNGVLMSKGNDGLNYSFEKIMAVPLQSEKLIGKLSEEDYFYNIIQSHDGTIWLGSAYSGMFKLVKETNIFKKFQKSNQLKSITDNHIWAFYQDGDELWIGTEKGVNIYNEKNHSLRTLSTHGAEGMKLSSNQIRSIFKDSQGNFWIGTYKKGLNKLNPNTGEIKVFTPNSPKDQYIADMTVWKIVEDSRKNLWFATHNGLQKTNLITGQTTVYQNQHNDSNSLSSNVVYNLYYDRIGNLWVSTFDGLNLYLPKSDNFKIFKRKPDDPNSLNTNRIFCVYQDTSLNYWIGTIGGGLNRLDMVTGEVSHFTVASGLADNTIYAILDDDFGNIWMPTNYGISSFNLQNKTFVNYSVNDGLTSNEFNFGAAMKDSQGNMFFGGMFGFNVFMPKQIRTENLKPELRIAEYEIDDEVHGYLIKSGEKITLNYKQKTLRLRLTMLDFINPLKTVYKYRVINYDDQYRPISANYPIIQLSKLSPGHYTLEIIAMNSAGIWTDTPFLLQIEIEEAWFNMLWFKISSVLLLLAIAFLFTYRHFKRLRFKHRTERQLLELEKQTLRLQMNPHFIFNTLNSIQNFILKNETDQSLGYLSKFSKLMRMMLNFSREPFISLADEIKLIETYMDLERLRLEKSFDFKINMNLKTDPEMVGLPPMIIQPFIENAIIHGLLPLKNREGSLTIDFIIEKQILKVRIEDNGVGRSMAKHDQIDHKPSGILITQKRLELINKMPDKELFYKIIDKKDKFAQPCGTIVELKIIFEELEN